MEKPTSLCPLYWILPILRVRFVVRLMTAARWLSARTALHTRWVAWYPANPLDAAAVSLPSVLGDHDGRSRVSGALALTIPFAGFSEQAELRFNYAPAPTFTPTKLGMWIKLVIPGSTDAGDYLAFVRMIADRRLADRPRRRDRAVPQAQLVDDARHDHPCVARSDGSAAGPDHDAPNLRRRLHQRRRHARRQRPPRVPDRPGIGCPGPSERQQLKRLSRGRKPNRRGTIFSVPFHKCEPPNIESCADPPPSDPKLGPQSCEQLQNHAAVVAAAAYFSVLPRPHVNRRCRAALRPPATQTGWTLNGSVLTFSPYSPSWRRRPSLVCDRPIFSSSVGVD